jgi:hypothetical protein
MERRGRIVVPRGSWGRGGAPANRLGVITRMGTSRGIRHFGSAAKLIVCRNRGTHKSDVSTESSSRGQIASIKVCFVHSRQLGSSRKPNPANGRGMPTATGNERQPNYRPPSADAIHRQTHHFHFPPPGTPPFAFLPNFSTKLLSQQHPVLANWWKLKRRLLQPKLSSSLFPSLKLPSLKFSLNSPLPKIHLI